MYQIWQWTLQICQRKEGSDLGPLLKHRGYCMSWVAGDEIFETWGQKKCSATHAKDFG